MVVVTQNKNRDQKSRFVYQKANYFTASLKALPALKAGTFAAGIVGGAQLASNNLKIENSTITTINNVTSTTLDNIVGLCVAIDVYNNDSSFVSYGNVTK